MNTRETNDQLIRAASLSLMVFAIGLAGFSWFADGRYGFVDIVYMTVITLTTVGFTEVIDLSGSPAGRVFVILLILGGVGSILYLLSGLAAFLSDGEIQRASWMRGMKRRAAKMHGHIIVCGGGSIGSHVVHELHTTERPFVLIEESEQRVHELHDQESHAFPAIVGDATSDERLEEAGIQNADGVISCLGGDNENLIVVMSSRMLRPDIRIVARCKNMALEAKLRRAGADSVVSPTTIGGMRLSSEMIRPRVVSFLDHMLHDKHEPLRVEEWTITDSSPLAGQPMADVRKLEIADFLVIALTSDADHWLFNPDDNAVLEPGMRLIFMSSPAAAQRFKTLADG